jgi:hypothetical protein
VERDRYRPFVNAALHVPLIASALLFVGFAVAEWRRAPVWARIHLGVATAFALAAAAHPGMTIQDALDGARDGTAYVVGLARGFGLVAALVTVATRLREFAAPR